MNICLRSTVYLKDENKEKETGMAHFLKKKEVWQEIIFHQKRKS